MTHNPKNDGRMEILETRQIPHTDLTYSVGSKVKYLSHGRQLVAKVTAIYPTTQPSRWDGVTVELNALDSTKDDYPNEAGKKVWAYESEILEVLES